jgi:hypothetical protein
MSSINEAYARIDYEALLNIEQSIQELKNDFYRLIGRQAISRIQGESLSVAKTRIFAERLSVPRNTDTVKIDFGPSRFESAPIVSATIATADDKQNPSDISLAIKSITRTSVEIQVERKIKQTVRLHVIAVGEAKQSAP